MCRNFYPPQAWADDIPINETNFPDEVFRNYVSSNFDIDEDGSLSDEEISYVIEIKVNNKGISNLKGIEYFTALEVLSCSDNSIRQLDLSNNRSLQMLNCDNNQLTMLNLRNNSKLTAASYVSQNTPPQLMYRIGGVYKFDTANLFPYENLSNVGKFSYGNDGIHGRIDDGIFILDSNEFTSIKNIYYDYSTGRGTISLNFGCSFTTLDGLSEPEISTKSLPKGQIGVSYTEALTATGLKPITWKIISGSFPSGLSLFSDGIIKGKPTQAGSYKFTVQARNLKDTTRKVFSITIDDDSLETTAPTITTESIPNVTVNQSYSTTLTAIGTTPITWSITSGSLPDGLELDSSTGAITGTPTASGTYNFSVQASNSNGNDTKNFQLTVASESDTAPAITTTSLSSGTVGNSYSATVSANSSTTTPVTWSVSGGLLPNGLSLQESTGRSVTISGTPTKSGTYTFTVQAKNQAGAATQEYTIKINESVSTVAPTITTSALPDAILDSPYGMTFKATGSVPITWQIDASELPPGFVFDSSKGYFYGTPTVAGTYDFTV